MGQSTTRHCIHLSGSSDAALAGERPFKLQKNMKRPDPLLVPLHGSQASIANSFAVPVKETWSTTVGNKTETKHQSTNCGALKREWYSHFTNSWSRNEAGKTSRNGDHI